jgi:hypothetical protein
MSEEGNFFNLKSGTEPALSVLLGTKKKRKKKRKGKAKQELIGLYGEVLT